MNIKFVKMHGLGNDFIMIDKSSVISDFKNGFIKGIANRRTGIGCDQVIFYYMISEDEYGMEVYNQDASRASSCGNALRCLGLLINEYTSMKVFDIIVNERKIKTKVISKGVISCNIGPISFVADWMPDMSSLSELAEDYRLNLKEMLCVDVGNAHIVIFNDSLEQQQQSSLGKKIQAHEAFPDSVNVNFASFDPKEGNIKLKVYERGAGFTLSCGTGACATFAAANKLGFVNNNCDIEFPLGFLHMSKENSNVIMTGPAVKVAEGYYTI